MNSRTITAKIKKWEYTMSRMKSISDIEAERAQYINTGGTSQDSGNKQMEFIPAFFDTQSNTIHLSRTCDGNIAAMHLLTGLAESIIDSRDSHGKITGIKKSVIVGFEKNGQFYTREQAAKIVAANKF